MIKVLFFAQTRELIGKEGITFEGDNISAQQLVEQLSFNGPQWKSALSSDKLLVAVNQEMMPMQTILKSGDEVAFFPPVTGG